MSDYLGAVFVSSRTIRTLDSFREGRTPANDAINALNELKSYFRKDNSCFLDYLQIREKTSDIEYTETLNQIDLAFNTAKEELRTGKSGKGIDSVIKLADDLGNICLSQAWTVSER